MPGDLNLKKSWHPGLLKNQELVWKREQEALEERRKIAERQREIERERERDELVAMQSKASGKPVVKRLEWMYSDASHGGVNPTDEAQEYLLGRRRVDFRSKSGHEPKVGVEKISSISSGQRGSDDSAELNGMSKLDVEAKERNDPLAVIKRKEMEALRLRGHEPHESKGLSMERSKRREEHRKSYHSSREHRSDKRYREMRDASLERSLYRSKRYRDYPPHRTEKSRDYSPHRSSKSRDYSPPRTERFRDSSPHRFDKSRDYSSHRSERSERSERSDRLEISERSERSEKSEMSERSRDYSSDRSDKSRAYSPNRTERFRDYSPHRSERSERSRDYSPDKSNKSRAYSPNRTERFREYSSYRSRDYSPHRSKRSKNPSNQYSRQEEFAVSYSSNENEKSREQRLKQMIKDAKLVEQSRHDRIKESDLKEEKLREQDSKMKVDPMARARFLTNATQSLLDGPVEKLRNGR